MESEKVTQAELHRRYPGIGAELQRVYSWFDVPLQFELTRVSMDRYRARAARSLSIYPNHPNSMRRTQNIVTAIECGESPWPIFCHAQDNFLLEGWHRIVALHMLRHTHLTVAQVTRILDVPEPDPDDFRLDEAEVVHDDHHVSVKWRGIQVGHTRINPTPTQGDGRHVDNTMVLPAYRRQGIAQRLYDEAEAMLRARGLRLVPSPEPILSDEAFGLWMKRAPHLLANDTRYAASLRLA